MRMLDTYRQFGRMFADSTPLRSEHELGAAVFAAGLHPEDVSRQWLLSLRRPWVYGESDTPFVTDRLNRRYFQMLFQHPDP